MSQAKGVHDMSLQRLSRQRFAIVAALRKRHGANSREVAARQHEVARRAADDFEAAGDPGMAQMLRAHAAHLAHAEATLPAPGSEATPP